MATDTLTHATAHAHEHGHHDAGGTKIFGFWIYLMSDCILFSILFATYAVLVNGTAGGPTGKDIFELPFVLVETFLLLFSSITYGMAAIAMYKNNKSQVISWLALTWLFGAGFIGMEIYEFHHLIVNGMGPENTLILIDGKPVSSRNSVRQGWRGERDTRGDTSWVPPEMIERIEVLRGPAAARYGNGAAGGVVNIITKKGSGEWHGSWDAYFNAPEHKEEGATKRTNFSLTGPLGDEFSFR